MLQEDFSVLLELTHVISATQNESHQIESVEV
jgi:hypothetical protein